VTAAADGQPFRGRLIADLSAGRKLHEVTGQLERRIIVSLAGKVAEKLCLRGSEPGCMRHRTNRQRTAFHEAGHLIAARTIGLTVCALTVAPPDIRVGTRRLAGYMAFSEFEPSSGTTIVPDHQQAARQAFALLGIQNGKWPDWRLVRQYLREARVRTEALLSANWQLVDWFATELVRRKGLSAEEIERVWADANYRPALLS